MSDRRGAALTRSVESTLLALGIISLIAVCHRESEETHSRVYSNLNDTPAAVTHHLIKFPFKGIQFSNEGLGSLRSLNQESHWMF